MATVWHPGQLLSTSSAYWKGCTLQAAVRLKIFSILEHGPLSGEDVAAKAESNTRATILLLDALSAMALITKIDGRYTNSDESQQFLVESSPGYMGHIILHHHHLLDGWAQLDQAVRTGESIQRRGYSRKVHRSPKCLLFR